MEEEQERFLSTMYKAEIVLTRIVGANYSSYWEAYTGRIAYVECTMPQDQAKEKTILVMLSDLNTCELLSQAISQQLSNRACLF